MKIRIPWLSYDIDLGEIWKFVPLLIALLTLLGGVGGGWGSSGTSTKSTTSTSATTATTTSKATETTGSTSTTPATSTTATEPTTSPSAPAPTSEQTSTTKTSAPAPTSEQSSTTKASTPASPAPAPTSESASTPAATTIPNTPNPPKTDSVSWNNAGGYNATDTVFFEGQTFSESLRLDSGEPRVFTENQFSRLEGTLIYKEGGEAPLDFVVVEIYRDGELEKKFTLKPGDKVSVDVELFHAYKTSLKVVGFKGDKNWGFSDQELYFLSPRFYY